MNSYLLRFFILTFLSLILVLSISAQTIKESYIMAEDYSDERAKFVIESFNHLYPEHSITLSGKECAFEYNVRKPNPLFMFTPNTIGKVRFEGVLFDSLKLYYDSFRDELICFNSRIIIDGKPFLFTVEKTKVDEFFLVIDNKEYRFASLHFPQNDLKLQDGYYHLLYKSQDMYFEKIKSIDLGDNGFFTKKEKYLHFNNTYHRITKSLNPDLFEAYSEDISLYMKKKKYKKNRLHDFQVIDILKYYHKLRE